MHGDADLLDRFFSWATAAWGILLLNAVALFRAWPNIMARLNERKRDAAAEKASDWARLRDEIGRLAERAKALEQECADLRARIIEREKEGERWRARALVAEAEVIRLEAYHQGVGEAKQTAQLIVSAERKDQDEKGNGK